MNIQLYMLLWFKLFWFINFINPSRNSCSADAVCLYPEAILMTAHLKL